jgi:hypothetical protein
MAGKPFVLYTRPHKDGKKVYYAKFKLTTGGYSTAKSTGETAKPRAEAWGYDYINVCLQLVLDVSFQMGCKSQESGKSDFF